jgi:hypothetical protein
MNPIRAAGLPGLLAPLNALVLPLIQAGVGAPLFTPLGLVVLEVAGRRSGRVYRIPLLAAALFNTVAVSTVRTDSGWVKNLRAAGSGAVWLRGHRYGAELVGELVMPLTGIQVMVLGIVRDD